MVMPIVPDYSGDVLGHVLPVAAASVGAEVGAVPDWDLPVAERVCVLLVDGLGRELLAESAETAPFLSSLMPGSRVLRAGFPTTTAVSMGSFGTGLPPGRHGMVGYEVLDPDRDVIFNELKWDPEVVPQVWQPYPTIFQTLDAQGVPSVRVGPARFAGSGLTEAALRGGRFVAADRLQHMVAATLAVMNGPAKLAYVYWGGVDYAGHAHGWRSQAWRKALHQLDRAAAALARRLPTGTTFIVTADHGMMDLPHEFRHDLADTPELLAGVRHIGGETRALQLYCEPERAEDVVAGFTERFGDLVWVRTRAQAVEQGWFGATDDRVLPRIGDVIVAAAGDIGLVDTRVANPKVLNLIGQHGSLTEAEQLVPLLVHHR